MGCVMAGGLLPKPRPRLPRMRERLASDCLRHNHELINYFYFLPSICSLFFIHITLSRYYHIYSLCIHSSQSYCTAAPYICSRHGVITDSRIHAEQADGSIVAELVKRHSYIPQSRPVSAKCVLVFNCRTAN